MGKKSQIEEIQEEARTGFDLRARLAEANNRTKTVTVYTDAALGADLGYAEDEEYLDGLKTGKRIRKGLVGELDELQERARATLAAIEAGAGESEALDAEAKEIQSQIAAVGRKITALRKKLDKTALVFTLKSLPDVVIRGNRRAARKHFGLKNKGVPESLQEEYDIEFINRMLASSVTAWEDKKSGEKFTGLTVEQARDLRDYLPRGQFPRLDGAMVELSFEVAIGNAAVDDVDF